MSDQTSKNQKMIALLKEYKKNGEDPGKQKKLEEQLEARPYSWSQNIILIPPSDIQTCQLPFYSLSLLLSPSAHLGRHRQKSSRTSGGTTTS